MAIILPLLIALVVVYLIRQPKQPPSMEGRLVARSPELHAEIVRNAAERRASRAATRELLLRERDRIDAYESKCYREYREKFWKNYRHIV
jgi:hypothetical protein